MLDGAKRGNGVSELSAFRRVAGGIADDVTGLVHFGFRHYDPESGRWMARDPIFLGGGQWNLYAYVGNQVANKWDYLGLTPP